MPADRRITASFSTTSFNESGEPERADLSLELWATRVDTGADRLLETGGTRGQARRTYRVRWLRALVDAVEAGETVTIREPGGDLEMRAITIAEPEGTRRRFLDVTAEGSS